MAEINQKMIAADVLVLATPVYFYSMNAQLKALIDRTYAQYMQILDMDVYMIVTGAAPTDEYFDAAIAGLRGFISCLPRGQEKGIVYGTNASEKGTVKTTPAMQEAYSMGKFVS